MKDQREAHAERGGRKQQEKEGDEETNGLEKGKARRDIRQEQEDPGHLVPDFEGRDHREACQHQRQSDPVPCPHLGHGEAPREDGAQGESEQERAQHQPEGVHGVAQKDRQ